MAITTDVLNTSGTLKAREIDLVMQFQNSWDLLLKILGISRPIQKKDGEDLVYYTAERVGELNVQAGEGEKSVDTDYQVKKAGTYKLNLERLQKTTTAQSVMEYGVDVALTKTDEEFISDIQFLLENRFYGFLGKGTLKASRPTFLGAVAASKGILLNRAAALHKTIKEIVGFCGIMDLYNYLGEQQIQTQNAFGLTYVENFLGYRYLFLLPDTIASGKVYSTPMSNMIAYFINPADEGLQRLGLTYTVAGKTNLIGVATKADYEKGEGTTFAMFGLTLFAERIDLVAETTIDKQAASDGAPTLIPASAMEAGSPNVGVSDGKRKKVTE